MERRTNAASDQTKYALAVALKELMAQKPIDKITIHDLTERCGIGRQNFYYHFPTYTTSCAGCFRRRPWRCCSSTRDALVAGGPAAAVPLYRAEPGGLPVCAEVCRA